MHGRQYLTALEQTRTILIGTLTVWKDSIIPPRPRISQLCLWAVRTSRCLKALLAVRQREIWGSAHRPIYAGQRRVPDCETCMGRISVLTSRMAVHGTSMVAPRACPLCGEAATGDSLSQRTTASDTGEAPVHIACRLLAHCSTHTAFHRAPRRPVGGGQTYGSCHRKV